jgi:hypothetical protein
MLELPNRQNVIARLREASEETPIAIWDYDSYDIEKHGLASIFGTIFHENLPFAHAFIVAVVVNQQLVELENYINDHIHAPE